MNFRACVQLPLDVDGIYASIGTQMPKTPHILISQLADLNNEIKIGISTLKKNRGVGGLLIMLH